MQGIAMRKIAFAAALIAAAGLAGTAAHAQTAIPPSPKDFLAAASQSDEYEIQAGHTAQAQSRDPRVRAFAEQMIRDHTQTREALGQAAAASGMAPPWPAMSADQARMLGSLQSLRGTDFDQAYARQQALAHAQAVAVQGSFASAGADPNLRRAAQAGLPTIQGHLEMARQLSRQTGAS